MLKFGFNCRLIKLEYLGWSLGIYSFKKFFVDFKVYLGLRNIVVLRDLSDVFSN